MSNFFNEFDVNANKFFNGFVPLKPITYCVVIIYDNDYKKEIYGIENPFRFMNSLKKNPRVKSTYIKNSF